MADLIQKTDSLNDGRVKLNEAIKDADTAKVTAKGAEVTAGQARQIAQTAESKADSVQAQFDQVVIEGDSSVEAAQARVDEKGTAHPTLKARLDAEHSSVTSQLADTDEQTKAYGFRTRFDNMNDINIANLKVTSDILNTVDIDITTPYGDKEVVHPDIFYAPNGWNGYRYWMAITPYKNQSEAYENPCIYASVDSINWVTPTGLTNPLEPYPVGTGTHYSDPCWILDKNGYTLHIVYRLSGAGSDNIYYIQSSDDGVYWSPKKEMYRVSGREIVSPDIIWTGEKYYMYYIDMSDEYKLKRVESDDLFNWKDERTCVINGTSKKLWHIDIIEYGGGLIMTACDTGYNNLILFKARDYGNFTVSSEDFLTRALVGRGLYKSDIQIYKEGENAYLMLYYSVMGDNQPGGLDYRIRRTLVPLKSKRLTSRIFSAKLQYLNTNSSAVEGDVPTTNIVTNYVSDELLTHFTFRIDIGDISELPTGRFLVITLPETARPIQGYWTFPIEHYGNSSSVMALYGIIDGATNRLYIRNQRYPNSTDMNMYTHKLTGITSLRGSVTYINNK